MPAKLSVNVNKYALLRNSRGHDAPNLLWACDTAIAAGCHGITVHPRLDQRHVRFDDVPVVREHLAAHHPGIEFNIECENHPDLIDMVVELRPEQCTLVPVTPGEVTSDHGWDLPREAGALAPTVQRLRQAQVRVSVFMDCEPEHMVRAAAVGVDRVELYTGPYAWAWGTLQQTVETARLRDSVAAAVAAGLGVNAGHDLDRHNLEGIADAVGLDEVSIGHAQICRALEVGTTRAVQELLVALGW